MPTDAALEATRILRDGGQFQWYVIPLLALIFYVYAVDIAAIIVFAGFLKWI